MNNNIINNTATYIYWICWSVIVGGMLLAGPLLAPLAFKIMPLAVTQDIAPHAHAYASILFTLFFVEYFPIVAILFLVMSFLDQWKVSLDFQNMPRITLFREVLIVCGNFLWIWIAMDMVPEMESMVMDQEKWNQIEVREAFASLHTKSQRFSELGLVITMLLPFFSTRSGMKFGNTFK